MVLAVVLREHRAPSTHMGIPFLHWHLRCIGYACLLAESRCAVVHCGSLEFRAVISGHEGRDGLRLVLCAHQDLSKDTHVSTLRPMPPILFLSRKSLSPGWECSSSSSPMASPAILEEEQNLIALGSHSPLLGCRMLGVRGVTGLTGTGCKPADPCCLRPLLPADTKIIIGGAAEYWPFLGAIATGY